MSGVFLLPLIIAHLISSIFAGATINYIGYFQPFLLCGATILAIGLGVFTLSTPDTSRTLWIVWQVVIGLGAGLGLQASLLPAQVLLANKDTAVGLSLLNFGFVLGGAVSVPIAQAVLLNLLSASLSQGSVHLNIDALLSVGWTRLASSVPPKHKATIIDTLNGAIMAVFYIAAALAAVSFFGALGIKPTLSVKKQQPR